MGHTMNQTRTLVLFTTNYPHTGGEQFINSEIDTLCKAYAHVVIVPVSSRASDSLKYGLPGNAMVLPPPGNPWTIIGQYILAIPRTVIVSVREKRGLRGTLEEARFSLSVGGRARHVTKQLSKTLGADTAAVFYSYWLHRPAAVAVEVRRLLRWGKTPVVSRAHGYDLYDQRATSGRLPQRLNLLRALAKVYAVSDQGASYLRAAWPEFASKIDSSPLGVTPANNPGNATLEARRVISCSYIVPLKRIPLLIDALAIVHERGFHLRWSHIGPVDTPYGDAVRAYALEKLGMDVVDFVGELSPHRVREWLDAHPGTLFINVSEYEGVPVTLQEALAQGLPVIATDVGGTSSTIRTAGGVFAGLLDSHPTPADVADRIIDLISANPHEYRGYVTSAIKQWSLSWDADSNYSSFTRELERVITSGDIDDAR